MRPPAHLSRSYDGMLDIPPSVIIMMTFTRFSHSAFVLRMFRYRLSLILECCRRLRASYPAAVTKARREPDIDANTARVWDTSGTVKPSELAVSQQHGNKSVSPTSAL